MPLRRLRCKLSSNRTSVKPLAHISAEQATFSPVEIVVTERPWKQLSVGIELGVTVDEHLGQPVGTVAHNGRGVCAGGEARSLRFPGRITNLGKFALRQRRGVIVHVKLKVVIIGAREQEIVRGQTGPGAVDNGPFNVPASADIGGTAKETAIVCADIGVIELEEIHKRHLWPGAT